MTGQVTLVSDDRLRWVDGGILMQEMVADHGVDTLEFAVLPSTTDGLEDTVYRLMLAAGGVSRRFTFEVPAGEEPWRLTPERVTPV